MVLWSHPDKYRTVAAGFELKVDGETFTLYAIMVVLSLAGREAGRELG